jgi:hypothetical protein
MTCVRLSRLVNQQGCTDEVGAKLTTSGAELCARSVFNNKFLSGLLLELDNAQSSMCMHVCMPTISKNKTI